MQAAVEECSACSVGVNAVHAVLLRPEVAFAVFI